MIERIFLVVCLVFLSACATTGGASDYVGSDKTCIRGGMPDGMTLWTEGATHVTLTNVSGIGWSNGWKKTWCVRPGAHVVGLQGTISLYQEEGAMEIVLSAGRNYRIRGKKTDQGIAYRLMDETREPEILVREFMLPRVRTTTLTPAQPPLIIPRR